MSSEVVSISRGPAAAAPAPWIERVADLAPAEFAERCLKARRPLVLTAATRAWPALARFTPDFFRTVHGARRARLRGREAVLGEAIAAQQASTAERPAPYPCTLRDCAGLLADLTPRFALSLPNRHTNALMPRRVFDLVNHLEIFFGGPGGRFPYLHYDMLRLHSWIAQVYGEKEFTLYHPGQERLLYVNPNLPWLSTCEDPDDLERYPLLAGACAEKVVLHAGETLFIPCGIWHGARCLTMNVTVAFDQLEAGNWAEFAGEVAFEERRRGHPLRARLLRAYLALIGPCLSLQERFGANRRTDWGA